MDATGDEMRWEKLLFVFVFFSFLSLSIVILIRRLSTGRYLDGTLRVRTKSENSKLFAVAILVNIWAIAFSAVGLWLILFRFG